MQALEENCLWSCFECRVQLRCLCRRACVSLLCSILFNGNDAFQRVPTRSRTSSQTAANFLKDTKFMDTSFYVPKHFIVNVRYVFNNTSRKWTEASFQFRPNVKLSLCSTSFGETCSSPLSSDFIEKLIVQSPWVFCGEEKWQPALSFIPFVCLVSREVSRTYFIMRLVPSLYFVLPCLLALHNLHWVFIKYCVWNEPPVAFSQCVTVNMTNCSEFCINNSPMYTSALL